jgi:hypothetical protein
MIVCVAWGKRERGGGVFIGDGDLARGLGPGGEAESDGSGDCRDRAGLSWHGEGAHRQAMPVSGWARRDAYHFGRGR